MVMALSNAWGGSIVTSSSAGLIKTSGNLTVDTSGAGGGISADLQGRVVVGGVALFNDYSEGGGSVQMPNAGNRLANAPVYGGWGAFPGTVFYNPLSIIYVRPVDGSSTYGSTPTIAYDFYTTAGAGSVITDAIPTGVWSGAPGASTTVGSYSLNYIGGLALGNDGYILAAGSPGSWTVNPAPVSAPVSSALTLANTIANAITMPQNNQPASTGMPRGFLPAGDTPDHGSSGGGGRANSYVNVISPTPSVSSAFGNGAQLSIVSSPDANAPTQSISLSQARTMMQGGTGGASDGDRDVRVPVSLNSLADIVNGGVNLPSGVEQQLFVVESN
jgi:hypothetical protein